MYKALIVGIPLEKEIKNIKEIFTKKLENKLNLYKVNSPIFLDSKTGLNDRLSGLEKPVVLNARDANLELSQSLAKWKRNEIDLLHLNYYEGIYTNMKAIRDDESDKSPIHSLYVEQYDWELKIKKEDRNIDFLKETVSNIYKCILEVKKNINKKHSFLKNVFSQKLTFITSEELLNMYPDLSPKEREDTFGKEKGLFFVIGIGHELSNGQKHDNRSTDYDDWNLNGDLFIYSPLHKKSIEISSMGIRVDSKLLSSQIKKSQSQSSFSFDFHKKILSEQISFTIGGGIGQSRLILMILELYHIWEFPRSYWTKHHREKMQNINVFLK